MDSSRDNETQSSRHDAESMPTAKVDPPTSGPSSSGIDHGRFTPGVILADRYRVLGRLGRGGMGEVYKADDLKLGVTVALKFLPPHLGDDPRRMEEVRNEVRVARQIAHPHVCRVYDIGECTSDTGVKETFLSMEFVDGEDLSSLLRRIGRLPTDKAVEIARQLCAGLGAAHAVGVLHRDLKPANLMLDGRGRLRIMDFGLAAVAEQIVGRDATAGTPAYMAPEQLAGEEVTVRSDLFALGLVLYELFTGQRAFQSSDPKDLRRLQQESRPASASSLVEGLDAAVERAIDRCLQVDPQVRPRSALEVAAALPGGDPLAAALAAGETPSPEMVAASVREGSLRPAIAGGMLATVLIAFALMLISSKHDVIGRIPLPRSPSVLVDRIRELVRDAGHTGDIMDEAHGGWVSSNLMSELAGNEQNDWSALDTGWPSPLTFWYRSSPSRLLGQNVFATPQWNDPAPTQPGMVSVITDMEGRLDLFRVIPERFEPEATDAERTTAPPAIASTDLVPETPLAAPVVLFERAGLDMRTFESAEPLRVPPDFADERLAWVGPDPTDPDRELRVEAAMLNDKVVYFDVMWPWDLPRAGDSGSGSGGVGGIIGLSFVLAVIAAACVLARRHLLSGRGDRRGARRLGFVTLVVTFVAWQLQAGRPRTLQGEWSLMSGTLGLALFVTALTWVLYLALEPYVRRQMPSLIVSWVRLLDGRFKDPLVGRDVLVGLTAGALVGAILRAGRVVPEWLGYYDVQPQLPQMTLLLGGGPMLSSLLMTSVNAVLQGVLILLGYLLFRAVVRLPILAAGLLFLLLFGSTINDTATDWITIIATGTVTGGILTFITLRFGLLATVCCMWVGQTAGPTPFTTDTGAWYAHAMLLMIGAVFGMAGWAFYTSTRDRSVSTR